MEHPKRKMYPDEIRISDSRKNGDGQRHIDIEIKNPIIVPLGERPHGQEGEEPPIPEQPDSHEDAPRHTPYSSISTGALLATLARTHTPAIATTSKVVATWVGDVPMVALLPNTMGGFTPETIRDLFRELSRRGEKQETPAGGEPDEGSSQ
jgi:hypothetical protein